VAEKDESSTQFYTESLGTSTKGGLCTHPPWICKPDADVTTLIIGMNDRALELAAMHGMRAYGWGRACLPAEASGAAGKGAAWATGT